MARTFKQLSPEQQTRYRRLLNKLETLADVAELSLNEHMRQKWSREAHKVARFIYAK